MFFWSLFLYIILTVIKILLFLSNFNNHDEKKYFQKFLSLQSTFLPCFRRFSLNKKTDNKKTDENQF
ncbi:hypothetical protein EGY05_05265 [Chryseobacterium arthrosphaerae]|nr:hypothetical protein EGY05_05265 [Chryseobacterium arthrosphaerae]